MDQQRPRAPKGAPGACIDLHRPTTLDGRGLLVTEAIAFHVREVDISTIRMCCFVMITLGQGDVAEPVGVWD